MWIPLLCREENESVLAPSESSYYGHITLEVAMTNLETLEGG